MESGTSFDLTFESPGEVEITRQLHAPLGVVAALTVH